MLINNETIILENVALQELGFFDELDKWSTHNKDHSISKFRSSNLTDEEYDKVKALVDTMRNSDDYAVYAKAFNKFCYFCHILARGVIIRKLELKRSLRPDRSQLYVEYSYNVKKMTLPDDVVLYHMSKVGGIKELIPQFKGKSEKGYLYDKPRVYFTIRRHMPKFLADYKFNEKMYIYKCTIPIKQVYVDPLVWGSLYGAVYVETNKPIPVEEITPQSATEFIKTAITTTPNRNNKDINKEKGLTDQEKAFVKSDPFKQESVDSLVYTETYCENLDEAVMNISELYDFINENGLVILDYE